MKKKFEFEIYKWFQKKTPLIPFCIKINKISKNKFTKFHFKKIVKCNFLRIECFLKTSNLVPTIRILKKLVLKKKIQLLIKNHKNGKNIKKSLYFNVNKIKLK